MKNGIIYCSTRKDVERVYDNLTRAGIQTGYYHAGLSDEMRKDMQNKIRLRPITSYVEIGRLFQ